MFFDCALQLCFWPTAIPRAVRGIWDIAATASAQPPALLLVAALVLPAGGYLLARALRCPQTTQHTALSLLSRSHVRHMYTVIMTRIAPDKSALIALHDHVQEPGLEKQALAGVQTHAAGGAKRRERGRSRSGPMVGDRQARAKVAARRRLELAAGQCGAADMAGGGLGKIDPVVVAGARPGKYCPAPIGQKPLGGMLDGAAAAAAAAADCGVWSGSPLLGLQIGEYGKAHGLQVARGGIPGTADEPSFSLFSSSFLD